jgi:hypothetical protein
MLKQVELFLLSPHYEAASTATTGLMVSVVVVAPVIFPVLWLIL